MVRKETSPRVVGVIDIGSSAIRMVVMEIHPDGRFNKLDRASKPIQLGRDVFLDRVIKADSMHQAIRILGGFRELFRAWDIAESDIFTIATSAIREAKNRDTFVDRVLIKTGLHINIAEGVEENHLTYLAVLHAVEDLKGALGRSSGLIMEVGGGSTELMIIDRGKVVAAHLFRIGTLRMDSVVQESEGVASRSAVSGARTFIDRFRSTLAGVQAEFNLSRIRYFVMVGGDARTAASLCGRKVGEHYSLMAKDDFLAFVHKLESYSVDEMVRLLNVTYYEAENLLPALSAYRMFLEETGAEEIVVPDVSIREGVLLRFALGDDRKKESLYRSQIHGSALSLGRKYHFDEAHGLQVSTLATSFFDQFMEDHGMGARHRTYIQVAGLLHDIGYFVRATGHHKHSQYIIQNSEIFGLGLDELNIIGQIVRYHRSVRLVREHPEFNMLSQQERLVVLKLSAILRICDAMDRSHMQRISEISLSGDDEHELLVQCQYRGDIGVERQAVEQKSELFEEVFGYRIRLV